MSAPHCFHCGAANAAVRVDRCGLPVCGNARCLQALARLLGWKERAA